MSDVDAEILREVETALDKHGTARWLQAMGDVHQGRADAASEANDPARAMKHGQTARVCYRAAKSVDAI